MNRKTHFQNNWIIVNCPNKLKKRFLHNLQMEAKNKIAPNRAKRSQEILDSINKKHVKTAPKQIAIPPLPDTPT